jgi:hypothetical protein
MSYFDIETAQPLPKSPTTHTQALCAAGAFEMYFLPLDDLIAKGFSPCSTIYYTPDGDVRPGSEPIPIAGVRFTLSGIDPVILASEHGRGFHPIVTIYDTSGDEVSFPVNTDIDGDVTICSKIDLTGTGHVAVIR